jgi:hypothetical protein
VGAGCAFQLRMGNDESGMKNIHHRGAEGVCRLVSEPLITLRTLIKNDCHSGQGFSP